MKKIAIYVDPGEKISPHLQVIYDLESALSDEEQAYYLDLQSVKWIPPAFVVPFCSIVDKYRKEGKTISVAYSDSRYLKAIHFENGIDPEELLSIPEGKTLSYLPLIKINFDRGEREIAEEVLSRVGDLIRSQINPAHQYYSAIRYVMQEIADNIDQHSKLKNGWLMCQYFPKKGFLDICILDNGIGIRESYLQNGINVKSDFEALEKAVAGVSTKGKLRGYGISSTFEMLMNGLKGTYILYSGNALLHNTHVFNDLPFSWQGTYLFLRLPHPTTAFNLYDYIGR